MTEERKWEDLDYDCLVNILGRVGIETLLLDVPFVCKSWHKASFNPLCFRDIDIPTNHFIYGIGYYYSPFLRKFIDKYVDTSKTFWGNFSVGGFIRLLLARGLGKSSSRILTGMCHFDECECVAEKCPELKSLKINSYIIVHHHDDSIPKMLGKLKQLEEIELDIDDCPAGICAKILALIGHNFKNLNSLILTEGEVHREDALAIGKHLPRVKKLSVECCDLSQEALEIILRSCKDLEYLDVSECSVAHDHLEEMKLREMASHLKSLRLDVHFE